MTCMENIREMVTKKTFTVGVPAASTVNKVVRNFFAVVIVLLVVMSVVLYARTSNEATIASQAANKAVAQAVAADRKSGAATCAALVELDHASSGIHFSAPTATGTAELYVIRFSTALHHLVVVTGCEK